MSVDLELQPILDQLRLAPPIDQVPLDLLRPGAPLPGEQPAAVAKVANRQIRIPQGELPVRIYVPHVTTDLLPALVYFHGGGFVLGNLDTHDAILRSLAVGAGCLVVSVEYRLAPEHRFPAAVDDCLAAVRWSYEHAADIGADQGRITVGGDSAGANLAAVVALRLRDEGGATICGQLLVCPVTRLCAPMTGSMATNGEGYFLTASAMRWFASQYLGDLSQSNHPHASPLLANDLSRLPPALVITAEYDPLCDQGEEYAKRLREAGVVVTLTRYAGAIHGFFGMPVGIGRRAIAEAAQWLKHSCDLAKNAHVLRTAASSAPGNRPR